MGSRCPYGIWWRKLRTRLQLAVSTSAIRNPVTMATAAISQRHGSCGSLSATGSGRVVPDHVRTDLEPRLKVTGSHDPRCRAYRSASVPDTHTGMADPTKTAPKRPALALKVVRKTSR